MKKQFKVREDKKKVFRSTLIDKIPSMNELELENISITFVGYDGHTRTMACKKGFFNDKYGKRLNSGKIVQKINTFTNDFGAKYFTIQ
jgi:hypothetical protein